MLNILKMSLSLLLLFLAACGPTTSIDVKPQKGIETVKYDGDTLNISQKRGSEAVLSSRTKNAPNGNNVEIFVAGTNKRQSSFELNTQKIKVKINGKSARIFTYEELKKETERSRNIALFATALSGAAQAYSASMPQTTYGTYNSYGTYGSSYGSYSATTYNSASSQIATAAANAQTSADMASINSNAELSLSKLKQSYLKPTTMLKGIQYGGIIKIEAPRLKKDETQSWNITVKLGNDLHNFNLERKFD